MSWTTDLHLHQVLLGPAYRRSRPIVLAQAQPSRGPERFPVHQATRATPTLLAGAASRAQSVRPLNAASIEQGVQETYNGNGAGPPISATGPSAEQMKLYGLQPVDWKDAALSIVVVGASGDLARKKIYPALFALYVEGVLPPNFSIVGYSRSKMTDTEFRDYIMTNLTCRVSDSASCGDKMDAFLDRLYYHPGQYDSDADFAALSARMDALEQGKSQSNRIFYLSIPPSIFTRVAACASTNASSSTGYTRVIVEKPFGRDSESFRELSEELNKYLTEEQMYRIDHYLGKELIENLTVLRFSNLVFEPLWSRQYIRNVQVIFSEDFGTEGRGGYFDQYGIIRDVIQNHLLQILALFAMEPPVSLDAEDIRNEKVKVLRSMKKVTMDQVVVGQYRARNTGTSRLPGYLDDPTVPAGSLCPTFAAMAMFINNARWDGVPFLLKAGKALQSRSAEIRVQFRHVPGNLYRDKLGIDLDRVTNELVIRIQPDEAIYLKINNKVPGLGLRLDVSRLDLSYKSRYNAPLPDAYERLILDVINGDKRLFIRNDELEAAWDLFTPILKELDEKQVVPELYPYGSRGPVGAHYLGAQHNVRWGDLTDADEAA